MPFRHFSPEATLFALVAAGVMKLFPGSKKRRYTYTRDEPSAEEEANISAMQGVVSAHEDCTAEVIPINVFGRRQVETFRLLSPGDKVTLRIKNDDIKVFAYGQYICELIPQADSNLERLLKDNVPFEAYLGGRDLAFLYSDTYDSCSIIVFYKLEGAGPTKVNLF